MMSRKRLIVSGMMLFAFLGTLTAQAGKEDDGRRFWGLWEAIDELDGSTEQVSISGGDSGQLDLLWRESYWTICNGRRGILKGTGTLDPEDRKSLTFEMTVTCFDPEETVLESTIRFELVGQNMLLATSPGAFSNLPFFRTSGRVRGSGRGDD